MTGAGVFGLNCKHVCMSVTHLIWSPGFKCQQLRARLYLMSNILSSLKIVGDEPRFLLSCCKRDTLNILLAVIEVQKLYEWLPNSWNIKALKEVRFKGSGKRKQGLYGVGLGNFNAMIRK